MNRHASGASLPDKFQGRHTTLEVKLPDLDEPETSLAIDPANIVSASWFGVSACSECSILGH